MSYRHELVEHDPEWVAAPLRINREGDTRPGFLCIHELENGNGWCGGNVFEVDDEVGKHSCIIARRGWWKLSRGCYDKYRRCPGWAGGGWKLAETRLCHGDNGGYLNVDYNASWWKWKIHRCDNCDVIVLPYMFRWTSPRSWWYEIKYARSSWMWLIKLETWWGKKTGRW
jgi:hypothetical protein